MALAWALAVALLWGFSSASAVHASEEDPRALEARTQVVMLDSSQCSAVARDELHELVALELAPRPVRLPSEVADPSLVMRAELTCSEARAQLFVQDVARGQQQELALDLTEIDVSGRARLLALALSELIATIDMEPPSLPAVVAPTPDDPADDLATEARSGARNHWWLAAGIARQGQPRILAPSLQTGLGASLGSLPLALLSELQVQRGERAVDSGRVVSWTASGSTALAGQLHTARLELALGLGVRLGYARLTGDTAASERAISGHAVSARWWGPTACASVLLPLSHARWGLRAGVDLTYVARGVRGLDNAGGHAYDLKGLLVHATLGVSVTLGEARRP